MGADSDFGIVEFVINSFWDVRWQWLTTYRFVLDNVKWRWLSLDILLLVTDSDLSIECEPVNTQLADFRGRNCSVVADDIR